MNYPYSCVSRALCGFLLVHLTIALATSPSQFETIQSRSDVVACSPFSKYSFLTWLSSIKGCPTGQCCSAEGVCGTGTGFCDSTTTTEQPAAAAVTSAATSSSETRALIDIPLTFYHPEEEMTATGTSTTLSITTASPSKTGPVETVPSGWSLRMYDQKYCNGPNYMTLEGHNKKLEDSACMVMPMSDISTIINDTSVSCRWWTEGGLKWSPCSESTLRKAESWVMSNGLCTVVKNKVCDNYNDIAQTYGYRGTGFCQNYKPTDPSPWGSMKCYVG